MQDSTYPDPFNWCKFEAVDKTSFSIVCSVLAAQCFLFCLFLRSLTIRIHNSISISSDEKKIFKLMALWYIIAFLKSILNIIVYSVYQADPTKHNLKSQIVLAAVCNFLDKMSSFILHTILMSIPCIWIKNTILTLQHEDLTLAQKKNVDLVFRLLKYIGIYLKARYIIVVINLVFDILLVIIPNIGAYAKYLAAATMLEAGIAIFIYTFGFISLYKFRSRLNFPQELIKRIIIQYSLLMVCCVARLTFNFMYFFSTTLKSYQPGQNCLDQSNHINVTNYIYLSLGYTTMHVLPITTIIMIYWPDIENNRIRGSIISFTDINFIKKRRAISAHWKLLGSGQCYEETNSQNQS